MKSQELTKQEKNMENWVEKYNATLKGKEGLKTRFKKFYSEVYSKFISVQSIKGFCPVCEEPLIVGDTKAGYCGYCGANFGENIKKEINLEEE